MHNQLVAWQREVASPACSGRAFTCSDGVSCMHALKFERLCAWQAVVDGNTPPACKWCVCITQTLLHQYVRPCDCACSPPLDHFVFAVLTASEPTTVLCGSPVAHVIAACTQPHRCIRHAVLLSVDQHQPSTSNDAHHSIDHRPS